MLTGVSPGLTGSPILAPEYSAIRPIDYSFRDVIALRTCVRLRQEASLQKIRRALDTLRVDLGQRDHLSSYRLVSDGSTIYFADSDHAVDLLRQKGNVVIQQFVEVLQPFYVQGRQIPALLEPREHVGVDPGVRGGEPVIAGTRIPYDEVAALLRDGVAAEDIGEFFPQVGPGFLSVERKGMADVIGYCGQGSGTGIPHRGGCSTSSGSAKWAGSSPMPSTVTAC